MKHSTSSQLGTVAVVFTTSMTILALEILYTRFFAALFWKNVAFAILSLAMLGLGSAGVVVLVRRSYFLGERSDAVLSGSISAFGVAIPASYTWILFSSRFPFSGSISFWTLALFIAVALLPFFCGGIVLATIFARSSERISKLYSWDLTGAALGSLVTLPALLLLEGPVLALVLSAVVVVVGLYFGYRTQGRLSRTSLASVLVVVAGFVAHVGYGALEVTHSRGRELIDVVFETWDPIGRVTVHRHESDDAWIWIDGSVPTPIVAVPDEVSELDYLRRNVLQLVHHFGPFDNPVIVGPGGGSDVLAALLFGNERITGVEINRSIVDLMKGEFAAFSGEIYRRPEVEIHVAEGRAFIAGLEGITDLIQITFIDTFTAAVAGSHTLSENYLYTTEAFGEFLGKLTDDGFISVSRWGGERHGFEETYRAVAIAVAALRELGVDRPDRHIAVIRGPRPEHLQLGGGYQFLHANMESMSTILIRKTPFQAAEIDKLEEICLANHFERLWVPGLAGGDETLAALVLGDASDRALVLARYRAENGLDISPVGDDRPFFFDFVSPFQHLIEGSRPEWQANYYFGQSTAANRIIIQLLVATAMLVALFLVVPLMFRIDELKRGGIPGPTLGYFACLGVGFIGIELGLVQRFSLFLGHPVYSLSVCLAGILLFSGAGSRRTHRLSGDGIRRSAVLRLTLLCLVLMAYGWLLPVVTRALLSSSQALKFLLCLALVAPPAYGMGMMFPLGIKALPRSREGLVPWLWGLNSGISVLGSIASLGLALSFGYTVTWYVFTAAYIVAIPCMTKMETDRGEIAEVHVD